MEVNQNVLEEAYPIIERLAKLRSTNGAFAYYESKDVYQEIWYMCLEALDRYNSTIGPIENYLVTHVTNRLKNLKRDKYFRPGSDIPSSGFARVRMNLINALPLGEGDIAKYGMTSCSTPINIDPIEQVSCNETLAYILERLPDHLCDSFEALIGQNKVRSSLVGEVRQKVAEILSERETCVGNQE